MSGFAIHKHCKAKFKTTLRLLSTTSIAQSSLERSENQVDNLLTSTSETALSTQSALPWRSLHCWSFQQWAQPDGTVVCFSVKLLVFFPSAVDFLLQGLYCCSVSTSFSAFLKTKSEGRCPVLRSEERKAALAI